MLIILASRHDPTARWLADEWTADGAALLTCEDLSCGGWEHDVSAPQKGRICIGGHVLARSQVRAVLTQLPSVSPAEIPGVVEYDREYVAEEMMAFLIAWLAALGRRAVNRPTPYCLMGPHWRQERWIKTARELGLATSRMARHTAPRQTSPAPSAPEGTSVTVVGPLAFSADGSPAPASQRDAAVRLATAAAADVLAVRFTEDDAVIDAHLWPDLRVAAVRAALRDLLLRRDA